jgi:hypothetical protein
MVLLSDSPALTDFFNHYGILDLINFMSLDEVNFKETSRNTVSESKYLTPITVKKLLAVQSWYAAQMSSFPDVYEDVDTFFLPPPSMIGDEVRTIHASRLPLRRLPLLQSLHTNLQLFLHQQHCQIQ